MRIQVKIIAAFYDITLKFYLHPIESTLRLALPTLMTYAVEPVA